MTSEGLFKKILVPFDGSKYSRKALAQAIEISKKFGSTLFVVAAVDTSDFPPGMLLGLLKKDKRLEQSVSEFVSAAKSEVRRMLLAEVAVCKTEGVDSQYDIIAGNPVDAIIKFERGRKIDLIVIGSQGLHGIGKLKALGSVSRKVSELATCPVMIVH